MIKFKLKLLLLYYFTCSSVYAAAATWNLNANGNWNVNANWTPALFPNAVDDTANFGPIITANRIISLGVGAQNITIGTVSFDDNNNYSIQSGLAGNTLIFDVSAGNASLNVTNANGNGAHSITCPIILNDPLLMTHSSSSNFTISGNISGIGGVTKAGIGTGSLVFSGTTANTYAGLTTVNSGTLQLIKTGGITSIAGNAQINPTGILLCSSSNQISNTSTVTLAGGTFNMTGVPQTIGSLVFNSGTFTQGGSLLSLASATPTTLTMGNNTTIAGPITFTNAGGVTYNGTTTRGTVSGNVALGAFNHVFDVADGTDTVDLTFSGVISGVGGTITKSNGLGVLQLSGASANTYTGLTTVNNGTLLLNKNAGINAIAGNVLVNGGILRLGNINQIINTGNVTLSGGTFDMAGNSDTIGSLIFNSGTLTQGGGNT